MLPEGSVVVEMDSRRIDRILRNLILNALEHGEGRPVNISVASNGDAVAVTVRDHGIGMSPAEAARVFDRFWRADPARARTTGGSGLGLSIATEDTKLHNGWLQAWGNTGVGSNFRLTLPLNRAEPFQNPRCPLNRQTWDCAAPATTPYLSGAWEPLLHRRTPLLQKTPLRKTPLRRVTPRR